MSEQLGKVLIAAPVHNVLIDGLTAAGYTCILHEAITQATAPALIHDCVGVITSTRLNLNKVLLDAAPQLRWIGRMGSGMEVIDVPYATQRGIACYSSPEGNCNAVGEHAVGMLLSLIRRIAWSRDEVMAGKWLREENRGYELEGKTIGIIGYGHTGAAFAKKLQGFDVRIMAYDKYAPEHIPAHITRCDDLTPIYNEADILSFHVPLQEDTVHYFNATFLENMLKPFILINTSRGGVVDTRIVWQGLQQGQITGACMDVWEEEPLAAMGKDMRLLLDEMIRLPQTIITPHIAGYTFEALYKMSKTLLDKIIMR
jgi:D-3-phosphoglycerate dehydrogenase